MNTKRRPPRPSTLQRIMSRWVDVDDAAQELAEVSECRDADRLAPLADSLSDLAATMRLAIQPRRPVRGGR